MSHLGGLVCLGILFGLPTFCQDPLTGLSGLTLKAALDRIADRVDVSIEKAGTVANGVVIRAGSEVWAEIQNFRAAYEKMLDKSVRDLDITITKQLAQIASDANALERRTAQDTQKVLALAQQGLNTVPFSNKHPQITFIGPSYGVFDPEEAKGTFVLTLRGNFIDSPDAKFTPTIAVDGDAAPLKPIEVTTQQIRFELPTKIFNIPQGRRTTMFKIPIVFPYKERHLYGSKRREATFYAALVGLPASPGKVRLEWTSKSQVTTRAFVTTAQDNIQSDRDDHDEDRCGPNESRVIESNTVKMVVDRFEGNTWTNHAVRLNNPSVCWHFRTEHHGIGTSDKVWFHFEYWVNYPEEKIESGVETLDLKWGESRAFPHPAGSFKITFDSLDGRQQQFLAANHDDRFVDISTEGGGVKIAARPLEGILPTN